MIKFYMNKPLSQWAREPAIHSAQHTDGHDACSAQVWNSVRRYIEIEENDAHVNILYIDRGWSDMLPSDISAFKVFFRKRLSI